MASKDGERKVCSCRLLMEGGLSDMTKPKASLFLGSTIIQVQRLQTHASHLPLYSRYCPPSQQFAPNAIMITATRNWFKRNRTTFAIGAGIVGVGYVATQYVVGKITEARQRMSDEKISRENLRRRFEQNQEDCTFTVLAILPTAYEKHHRGASGGADPGRTAETQR